MAMIRVYAGLGMGTVALVGFRGGKARTGQLSCEHLMREQKRE